MTQRTPNRQSNQHHKRSQRNRHGAPSQMPFEQTPQGAPDWSGLMAAALLSALPSVILFLILGRKAINSIQFSGVK